MAKIELSGNLTKDPNFFANENSADAVMFTVAENVGKDTEYAKTYFHTVKVRGAKARKVSADLAKGSLVRIKGILESYTKEGVEDSKGYPVVFWTVTAFDIDVYDREASTFKSVIKSETKGDKKAEGPKASADESEEDEVIAKPKTPKGKAAAPAVDEEDEF